MVIESYLIVQENVPKQATYLLKQFLSKKPCPAYIAVPADYHPGVRGGV